MGALWERIPGEPVRLKPFSVPRRQLGEVMHWKYQISRKIHGKCWFFCWFFVGGGLRIEWVYRVCWVISLWFLGALQKKDITTSKVGFPRSNGMEEDDLYNLIHYLNPSRVGNLCPFTAKKQTSGLKFDAFGGFRCTSIFIVDLWHILARLAMTKSNLVFNGQRWLATQISTLSLDICHNSKLRRDLKDSCNSFRVLVKGSSTNVPSTAYLI